MGINEVFIEAIKDIDKRKIVINNLISVIKNINNISYYYIFKWKKRKNPNIEIKNNYDVLLNSWVTILYSHWEWFLKYSWKKYLEFLKEKSYKREKLDKCFTDYYINNKKNDLSSILQNIVDDSPIPIDLDMLKDIQNLDYDNTKILFKRLWFDFDNFIKLFSDRIEYSTWLNKCKNFADKIWKFKRTDHFLKEYIEQRKNSLDWDKTLQNIIKSDNKSQNKCNSIWLVSLRHKIAHWSDINIDFERFISLSNIVLLLLEVYLDFFKNELTKKYK